MSFKKKNQKNSLVAQLVNGEKLPCVFCRRKVNDEILYGKLYSIGDIQCHYFCVLLSCCLVQNGNDDEGLLGFLYTDILAEVERSKKHKCSYCGKGGSTLGCSISRCRKQFHLPCGQEHKAISMFYGNYKSYCELHAPKQDVADSIMVKVKERLANRNKKLNKSKRNCANEIQGHLESEPESLCAICYEEVDGFPTTITFWPPCCARDAWFHRTCLQRMILNAGMHYVKCPLCNDKDIFFQEVVSQGYYVPDRDAAWELEQNAFAEIYERPVTCSAQECHCPMGRNHDSETGMWDVKLCLLCGSSGAHAQCLVAVGADDKRFICEVCKPAAPANIETLESALAALIQEEQDREASNNRTGPIMPVRMSLRRTKRQRQSTQRYTSASRTTTNRSTTATPNPDSNKEVTAKETVQEASPSNTEMSRAELNIKCPRRRETNGSQIENRMMSPVTSIAEDAVFSPVKVLEKELLAKVKCMGVKHTIVLNHSVMEEIRRKFRKPKPLSQKRKIINAIINQLIENVLSEQNVTKPTAGWNSFLKTWESSSNDGLPQTPQNKQSSILGLLLQQEQENQRLSSLSPRKSPITSKTLTRRKYSTTSKTSTPKKEDNGEKCYITEKIRKSMTPGKSPSTRKMSTPRKSPRLEFELITSRSPLHKGNVGAKSPKSEKDLSLDKFIVDLTTPKKVKSSDQLGLKTPDQKVFNSENSSNTNINSVSGTPQMTEKALKLEKIIMQLSTPKKKEQEVDINFKAPNRMFGEIFTGNQKTASSSHKKSMANAQEFSRTPLKTSNSLFEKSEREKSVTKEKKSNSISLKFPLSSKDRKSTETLKNYASHTEEIESSVLSHFFSENDNSNAVLKPKDEDNVYEKPIVLVIDDDDDKSSTNSFQLPPEFIAETLSDDSLPILETPKKRKTVDIQKDSSMEISENDEVVNIDLVTIKNHSPEKIMRVAIKSPEKLNKCAFKVNPKDKETLQSKTVAIDIESFKNHYLNEVDKKNAIKDTPKKVVRFSSDTINNEKKRILKRKKELKSKQANKKRKLNNDNTERTITIANGDEKPKPKSKKLMRKKVKRVNRTRNTNISIEKNIQVKIRWKKKELKVKITNKKKLKTRRKKELKDKTFKQYVLQFKPEQKELHSPTKMVLAKPENNVNLTSLKKKKIKLENSPDNLVQTSIQNFFKRTTQFKFEK